MTKKEFIKEFSKIEDTFEDEFRAEFNSPELIWKALKEQLTLTDVGSSLPTEKKIHIEAERRFPYKKHLVDYNNGLHEGFIDGADFVLEAIKKTK